MNKKLVEIILVAGGAFFSLLIFPKFALAATLTCLQARGNFTSAQRSASWWKPIPRVLQSTQPKASLLTARILWSWSRFKQGSTFYLTSPGSPAKGSGTAYFAADCPSRLQWQWRSAGQMTFRPGRRHCNVSVSPDMSCSTMDWARMHCPEVSERGLLSHLLRLAL